MKRSRPTREWRQKIYRQCLNFKVKYFHENAINEEKSIIYSSEEKRLLHFTKATVEHIVPLCELVDTFLKSRGLDRTAKPTGLLLRKWLEFHRENAKLKVVSPEYNQLAGVEIWRNRGNSSC